jgi:hypothetical protein
MGALLALLRGDGKKPAPHVFVDFESTSYYCLSVCSRFAYWLVGAQPTEEERALYAEVRALLDKSGDVLQELEEYKGAGDHIRSVRISVGKHVPHTCAVETLAHWQRPFPRLRTRRSN